MQITHTKVQYVTHFMAVYFVLCIFHTLVLSITPMYTIK